MARVKFGFIGTGAITASAGREINAHPKAEIVATSDPNEERLIRFSKSFEISRTFPSARGLLGQPDVDAVYIAVPNAYHAPLAVEALNAGKHVILEKPFAMNLAQAKEVTHKAAAEKTDLHAGHESAVHRGITENQEPRKRGSLR